MLNRLEAMELPRAVLVLSPQLIPEIDVEELLQSDAESDSSVNSPSVAAGLAELKGRRLEPELQLLL